MIILNIDKITAGVLLVGLSLILITLIILILATGLQIAIESIKKRLK